MLFGGVCLHIQYTEVSLYDAFLKYALEQIVQQLNNGQSYLH